MLKNSGLVLLFLWGHLALAVPTDEINVMLQTQQEAWNRGDLDSYMQGYWHSDKLRFVTAKKFRSGWSEILAAYKKHYPNRETMGQLTFTVIDIKFFSNYAALVVGRWQLTRAKDKPNGVSSLLVEKIDGKWVITHDHSSN